MNQVTDNAQAYRRRPMSRNRLILAALAIVCLVPVLVCAVLVASFNPNRYAPQIAAAVEAHTGRTLTFGGPITMGLSFTPTLHATGLTLSNPPGFADSGLLTLQRVDARIALIPLFSHRLDILDLVLVGPHLMLEQDASGDADWDIAPKHAAPPPGAAPATVRARKHPYSVALKTVDIENGEVTIRNGASVTTIAISHLTGRAASPEAPLLINATALLGATPVTINGVLGPVIRFSGVGSGPWPVDLTASLGAARLTINGAIARPRSASGYHLALAATIPAVAALAKTLPPGLTGGIALPPLMNVAAKATIADQGAGLPAITDAALSAGPSDLAAWRPGLHLDALSLAMPALDRPVTVDAKGELNASAFSISGDVGAPQALFAPATPAPGAPPQAGYPVDLAVALGDNRLGVNGAIATPQTLAGAALAISASIPNLATLDAAAGIALPAWTHIALQTTLIDPGGLGLRNAVGLDGLVLTMDNAQAGGDASLYFGPEPRLQLALKFTQANVDALAEQMPAAAPSAPPPAAGSPATSAPSAPGALPGWQLPLTLLKTASADVQLAADTLIWRHETYTALQAHAVLAGGVLTLNPITGQLPGGSVSASLAIDATKTPAAESLSLDAPALAISPFLASFGLPNTAQGTVELSTTATAQGNDLPAIAGSVNGELGLAMVDGDVDGPVLAALFGAALQTVGLPSDLLGTPGPVPVRCMALRLDAANGVGTVKTLTLDSSRLLVQGGGSVNFGTQALNLVLRPQLQVAGTQVGIPVQIGGTFEAPAASVAPAGALQDAAKSAVSLPVSLAQQVLGHNPALANAAGQLGLANNDVCPAALALGRLGKPGPAAPPVAAPAAPGAAPSTGPRNLLNAIFGK